MKLISFKISDELAERLEALQGDEKSLSLVAKRILEESLDNASRKQPVDEKLDQILEIVGELRSQTLGESHLAA